MCQWSAAHALIRCSERYAWVRSQRSLAIGMGLVAHDRDWVCGDQPALEHVFQPWQQAGNALLRVDPFEHEWQVRGKINNRRRVDLAVSAVSSQPASDGGACRAFPAEKLKERAPQWLTVVTVTFPKISANAHTPPVQTVAKILTLHCLLPRHVLQVIADAQRPAAPESLQVGLRRRSRPVPQATGRRVRP